MTDAGIIAIVSGYVLLVGGYIPLVWKCLAYANALQAMDDERDKATVRAERAEFERDAFKQRLTDAEQTIEVLAKETDANPNADLDPRAVRERVLRAAAEAIRARGGEIPPSADDGELHPEDGTAARGAVAAEVLPARPPSGPLDPDESLL